MNLQLL